MRVDDATSAEIDVLGSLPARVDANDISSFSMARASSNVTSGLLGGGASWR